MKQKLNLQDIFVWVSIILVIVVIVNLFLAFQLNKGIKQNTALTKEKLKPAKIELALIKNSKCSDCSDISAATRYIKNLNANITRERTLEFDSKDGNGLISKYKIEKIPTVVVTGEIDKLSVQGFEKKDGALMPTKLNPPYTNTATGKIEGRVTMYHLKDLECIKCNDLKVLVSQIKGAGVKISEEKSISVKSDEGKELIKKYNIGFAPALILSKDAVEYSIINQAWSQIGSKESDGSYVLRLANPPFINLTTNELRGLVDIIYLADKSCSDCYNVSIHKAILASPQSFAMALDKEENYDISDGKGKELIAKYNITKVPTIILSGDVIAYPSSRILKQFFSVQKDGSYVFTRVSSVGTYKDLTTGQVVQAQQRE